MRNMSASRWVPAYDIYELVEQPTKYVVSITHEDRFTPGSDEVRAVSGRRVSDARILEEFTRLAHPKTDSADLFNFINSFGALGGMLDYLPSDLAGVTRCMTGQDRSTSYSEGRKPVASALHSVPLCAPAQDTTIPNVRRLSAVR